MIAMITRLEVTHGDRDSWGGFGLICSAATASTLARVA